MKLFGRIVTGPCGDVAFAVDGEGTLHRVEFLTAGREAAAALGPEVVLGDRGRHTATVARQLEQYFAGRRTRFEIQLHFDGTPFQCRVWAALLDIPFGETRSYGELAAAVGRPGAARAVGRANGTNPIPIVVPCHRVIGADGTLTGFGGGLATKRALLELEGVAFAGAKQGELF